MPADLEGLQARNRRRVRVILVCAVLVLVAGLVGGLPLWLTLGGAALMAAGAAYLHWFTVTIVRRLGPGQNSAP